MEKTEQSSNKLKVGIIGCGEMGKLHFKSYLKNNISELYTCDIDTDYKLILKKVDAVSICTPNYLHKEMAIEAMENGVDVLVEKPVGLNAEEVEEMMKVSRKTGRVLYPAISHRFRFPKVLKKEKHVRVEWLMKENNLKQWQLDRKQSGGGVLLDLGSHYFYVALEMLGFPKVEKAFSLLNELEGFAGIEKRATGFVKFEKNRKMFFDFSWFTPKLESRHYIKVNDYQFKTWCPEMCYYREVKDFLKTCLGGSPFIKVEYAFKVQKLIDELYKSSIRYVGSLDVHGLIEEYVG